MTKKTTATLLELVTLGLAMVACDREPEPDLAPHSTTPPSPSAPQIAASPSASAVGTSNSPYTGTWSGTYQARKGKVSVPKGVRYPVWKDEAGDQAVGAGTLELTIKPSGEFEGKTRGVLGLLAVNGAIAGDALKGAIVPGAADDDLGMRGILTGTARSAQSAEVTMRVSNRDGSVVRVARVTLSRATTDPP